MKVDFSDLEDALAARRYASLAEKHAFSMGYIDGAYGMEKGEHDTAKNWPNAYSAGYWEAKKMASEQRRVEASQCRCADRGSHRVRHIAQGYQNPSAHSHMFVPYRGAKNRYGYKWSATKNGKRVEGEACSGGLFQETVIKP